MPPNRNLSRIGTRVACDKCRARKIKCGGEKPKCARCARLGIICEYEDSVPSWAMISELQDRINNLETERQADRPQNLRDSGAEVADHTALSPSSLIGQPRRPISTPMEPFSSTSAYVESLSMIPHGSQTSRNEWHQLPSNAQLFDQLPPTVGIPSPLHGNSIQDTSHHARSALGQCRLPDTGEQQSLLEHFFMCTNMAYPIFHIDTLKQTVSEVAKRHSSITSSDILTVLYVLAVCCTSLPRLSPMYAHWSHQASDFYRVAKQIEIDTAPTSNLSKLRLLLLKTQYALYVTSAGNVWDLSGAAIRTAIDLGLHHNGADPKDNPLQQDMGKRLFWSAYSIDRLLSLCLGRPPAISDDWITAELPLSCDDHFIKPDGILPADPSPTKLGALAHFKIRMLQSEIHHRLYSPSQKLLGIPSQDWYTSILQRLSSWRQSNPPSSGFMNQTWFDLNWYNTRILLYRPAPNCPSPDRAALKHALTAASGVMRTFKEMYRRGGIDYNWLAMYQLFTAGVTYLNSLWQAHQSGWTIVPALFDAILDIQICTSVMEALAAVTPGTATIRNAFDTVSRRILRHLTSLAGSFSAANSPCAERASDSPESNDPIRVSGLDTNSSEYASTGINQQQHLDMDNAGPTLFEWDAEDQLSAFLMQPMGDWANMDWGYAELEGNERDLEMTGSRM